MPTLDNIHKIDAPFWARPGFTSFAKADEGGGRDDDDDPEDDDADDEDDDDEDDLADLSDEELRAELRKTQERLSKASGSSKTKRDRIKALKTELDEARRGKAPAKKDAEGDEDKPDAEAIRAEADRVANEKANTRIVKAEARGALAQAGVSKERVARAVGLLDLKGIDVDDDGEVDGLDDAIDALKKDWPELFPKERNRRSSTAGDDDRDGSAGRRGKGQPTTDELQAAALLGRSARR
jgi:hypothetical protein